MLGDCNSSLWCGLVSSKWFKSACLMKVEPRTTSVICINNNQDSSYIIFPRLYTLFYLFWLTWNVFIVFTYSKCYDDTVKHQTEVLLIFTWIDVHSMYCWVFTKLIKMYYQHNIRIPSMHCLRNPFFGSSNETHEGVCILLHVLG